MIVLIILIALLGDSLLTSCVTCPPVQLDAVVKQCKFWTGQPMTDIFRPTQPLDGRVVYRSNTAAALSSARLVWLSVFPLVLMYV